MKISGADFAGWYKSDWGHKDAHWDDFALSINGVEVDDYDIDNICPDDKICIDGGVVYLGDGREMSAQAHFRKWKKSQTHENVVFSVPKENAGKLIAAASEFGALLVKAK
jgi:hypothetical protein